MSATITDDALSTDDAIDQNDAQQPSSPVTKGSRQSLLGTSRAVAGLACLVGLVFLFFCSRPIWHTEVWGHLTYGRVIWQMKSLPRTEPLLPLATGMPLIDTQWLSQLIGFGAVSQLGVAGLQGLYAAAVALCVAMLAWRSYRSTGNVTFAAYAVLVFFCLAWGPLTVLRPQLAGLVCFLALLTRFTRRQASRSDWLLVPALFAAWANLDGSFLMGLGLLACLAIGQAFDVTRRIGSLRGAIRSDHVRRNVLLLELAAAAALLNPFGLGLYAEVLTFGANPNLQGLMEWNPLSLRDMPGQIFVAVTVLLAVLYRWTPRRVKTWEVLALVGFGCASLWSVRNLIWWAPIAALHVVQHVHAVLQRLQQPVVRKPSPRSIVWSIVTCGVLYFSFAFSPVGQRLIYGRQPDPSRAMTSQTPLAAVDFLQRNPPQGQMFNNYEWGDFLQWAGPEGLQVFANSRVDLLPLDVWQRYEQIIEQRGNWEEVLDRYAVNTILLDARQQGPLVFQLKRKDDVWNLAFEQDGQVVFVRAKPL